MKQCTWKKYTIMQHSSENHMRIRDKRRVFSIMRAEHVTTHHLLPRVGMTLGEFAFWHLMNENKRKAN